MGNLKKRLALVAERRAAGRARVDVAVAKAAKHAERERPGWMKKALESVRRYALTHDRFLAEQVGLSVPAKADRRATGAIMPEAARRGWIARDGYATDSWGAPKTCWRSLIHK
jgi:predicted ATPase